MKTIFSSIAMVAAIAMCVEFAFATTPNTSYQGSVSEPRPTLETTKIPVGSIVSTNQEWIGAEKNGWLPCNGGRYDTTRYSALNDVIGPFFGNGRLPDFQGMFLRAYKKGTSEEFAKKQDGYVENRLQDGTSFQILTKDRSSVPTNGGWTAKRVGGKYKLESKKFIKNGGYRVNGKDVWSSVLLGAGSSIMAAAGTGLATAGLAGAGIVTALGGIAGAMIEAWATTTKTYYLGAEAKITQRVGENAHTSDINSGNAAMVDNDAMRPTNYSTYYYIKAR